MDWLNMTKNVRIGIITRKTYKLNKKIYIHISNSEKFVNLQIRDGGLDTSPVLKKYCNTTSPAPLSTTGPTAWVKFHSDSSVNTGSGFHITYAAISGI
jgi:hypothetical protein